MNKAVLISYVVCVCYSGMQRRQRIVRSTKKAAKVGGARSSTDVKFDSSLVNAAIRRLKKLWLEFENEKALSDLLAVRKHFKDRCRSKRPRVSKYGCGVKLY